MSPRRRAAVSLALFFVASTPGLARAEPWFGWGDRRLEDLYEDGDIGVEDLVEGVRVARSKGGSQHLRAGTWLTLGGFSRIVDGRHDLGVLLIFAGAFDKLAVGPTHHLSETGATSFPGVDGIADGVAPRGAPRSPPAPPPVPFAPPPAPPPPPPPELLVTPLVARQAVNAAWKNLGLGVDDSRIDAMISRARTSAALPETRLRVMKVVDDSSQVGVIPTDTSTYDVAGANLYLEARFTWRLDRLLYADDEPTLERTRIERHDARERVSGRVIDSLFQWQRAVIARRSALAGSKELIDATLRMAEAEAALDVLTGGWFGGWVVRQSSLPRE
jgi:hypothetical protein